MLKSSLMLSWTSKPPEKHRASRVRCASPAWI
jgi:hypothetical protein